MVMATMSSLQRSQSLRQAPCRRLTWTTIRCQHKMSRGSMLCQHFPWLEVLSQHFPWLEVLCPHFRCLEVHFPWLPWLMMRCQETRS